MTKLKCWKKINNTKYVNKKQNKRIYVFPYSVNIGNNKWKDFNKKSQALKFANKYMKEHDTC